MKHFKTMVMVMMLGLAVGFLPKASWAGDVSVGIAFGVPFPIIEVGHTVPVHHPAPGFYVPPRQLHYRSHDFGRHQGHSRDYGYYENNREGHHAERNHEYWNRHHRD